MHHHKGHEFNRFCRSVSLHVATCLPIAITFSSSITIILTYVTLGFWLFGGHWKERIAMVRSSVILWLLVPLILWTAIGIFRYDTSFAWSIRYWFGHYPYLMIVVLAMIFARKRDRYAVLSCMNFGILLCCIWGVVHAFCHWNLSYEEYDEVRKGSIYLYRNTICFGVALALWGGLWICFPYTSRHLRWVRRILPQSLLDGMERASRTNLLDLAKVFVPLVSSDLRKRPLTLFLAVLRWAIVVFVMVYIFLDNPSRTAQLIILLGYAALLWSWNWKGGIIATLCIFLPFTVVLAWNSETFKQKAAKTVNDIKQAVQVVEGDLDGKTFSAKNRDRLGIWAALYHDALQRPLTGYGMERAVKIVYTKTGKNDPHNEFLSIQLQHGAVGLVCFTVWMASLLIAPFWLKNPWRGFGLFLGILVLIDCIPNNAFSYHRETYLLCISIALLATQVKKNSGVGSLNTEGKEKEKPPVLSDS